MCCGRRTGLQPRDLVKPRTSGSTAKHTAIRRRRGAGSDADGAALVRAASVGGADAVDYSGPAAPPWASPDDLGQRPGGIAHRDVRNSEIFDVDELMDERLV